MAKKAAPSPEDLERRRSLFVEHQALQSKMDALELQQSELRKEASGILATLYKEFGGGPFILGGKRYLIGHRGGTWFLRSVGPDGEVIL